MTDQRTAEAVCTCSLSGEIDLATASAISVAAAEAESVGAVRLVLDLGGVTFMDSQGIQSMVSAQRRLARVGIALELQAVPPRIVELLDLTGLRSVLGVD